MTAPDLRSLDWAKLYAQVHRYALFRTGKQAEVAQDLAQEAMRRMIASESMPWDPAREPNPARHLMSIVNSLLANERTSARARRTVSLEAQEERDPEKKRKRKAIPDPSALSEDGFAASDLFARRIARLRARLAGDALALEILDRTLDGCDTPAALCAATGRPLETVIAARRRMQHHALAVARDIEGETQAPSGAANDDARVDEEVA